MLESNFRLAGPPSFGLQPCFGGITSCIGMKIRVPLQNTEILEVTAGQLQVYKGVGVMLQRW